MINSGFHRLEQESGFESFSDLQSLFRQLLAMEVDHSSAPFTTGFNPTDPTQDFLFITDTDLIRVT